MLPLSMGKSPLSGLLHRHVSSIENGTLLLFDEPETHLHPNLITEFVRLLENWALNLAGRLRSSLHIQLIW